MMKTKKKSRNVLISRKLLHEIREALEWTAEIPAEWGVDNEREVKNRFKYLAIQCKKIESREAEHTDS